MILGGSRRRLVCTKLNRLGVSACYGRQAEEGPASSLPAASPFAAKTHRALTYGRHHLNVAEKTMRVDLMRNALC